MKRRRLASGLALLGALGALFLPQRLAPAREGLRDIRVVARQFAFEPAVIQVRQGEQVRLRLETRDVVHGIYIEGYDLQLQTEASQPGELVFRAEQAGTFRLRCSVICGSQHPLMTGELQVQPAFGLWQLGLAVLLAAASGAWNAGGRRDAQPG